MVGSASCRPDRARRSGRGGAGTANTGRGTLIAYADTSVLVPLFTVDALTERVRAWLPHAPADFMISRLVSAEFASAVARKHRMRLLTRDEAERAFAAFDAWERSTHAFPEVTSGDFATATTWLRRLDLTLRAPDAVHMALVQRMGAVLVTFDSGMATSARTLGVQVLEP